MLSLPLSPERMWTWLWVKISSYSFLFLFGQDLTPSLDCPIASSSSVFRTYVNFANCFKTSQPHPQMMIPCPSSVSRFYVVTWSVVFKLSNLIILPNLFIRLQPLDMWTRAIVLRWIIWSPSYPFLFLRLQRVRQLGQFTSPIYGIVLISRRTTGSC